MTKSVIHVGCFLTLCDYLKGIDSTPAGIVEISTSSTSILGTMPGIAGTSCGGDKCESLVGESSLSVDMSRKTLGEGVYSGKEKNPL